MLETARAALDQWVPVWIVIDGSTDGSAEEAAAWAQSIGQDRVRVFRLPENRGKGSAIYTGLQAAVEAGFEAILTMDADGQHPADLIPEFMRLSRENPGALILGKPIFGAEAPPERVKGREISNWWARAVTAAGRHRRLALRLPRLSRQAAPRRHGRNSLSPAGSTSTPKPPSASSGAAPRPSTFPPRANTSPPNKAASPTFATAATTSSSPGCMPASASASSGGCRGC
ncbi:MAG: glycosyltransferase [Verrucomicrobiales bacterium]